MKRSLLSWIVVDLHSNTVSRSSECRFDFERKKKKTKIVDLTMESGSISKGDRRLEIGMVTQVLLYLSKV